jgi:hypothetical protein
MHFNATRLAFRNVHDGDEDGFDGEAIVTPHFEHKPHATSEAYAAHVSPPHPFPFPSTHRRSVLQLGYDECSFASEEKQPQTRMDVDEYEVGSSSVRHPRRPGPFLLLTTHRERSTPL